MFYLIVDKPIRHFLWFLWIFLKFLSHHPVCNLEGLNQFYWLQYFLIDLDYNFLSNTFKNIKVKLPPSCNIFFSWIPGIFSKLKITQHAELFHIVSINVFIVISFSPFASGNTSFMSLVSKGVADLYKDQTAYQNDHLL